MKRLIAIISVIAAFGCLSISAKTPAELVTAFKNVLPTGQKAQMVWVQKDGCVYTVDSDTGIIRKITITSGNTPMITNDGKSILYLTSGKLAMMSWAGTGAKTIDASGYNAVEDYYYDATNKIDYAIVRSGADYFKINAATGDKSQIHSGGDDGLHISIDGKYLAADIEGNVKFGFKELATGKVTYPAAQCGSCNSNISPDNTYRLMVQYAGHNLVCVSSVPGITTGGTLYSPISKGQNLTASILAKNPHSGSCVSKGAEYGFESTNWIAPDIVIFIMTNSQQNPYMVKLSDPTKWVAIDDNVGCNIDQEFMTSPPDGRVFDRTPISIDNNHSKNISKNLALNKSDYISYLPDGRRLNRSATSLKNKNFHGVIINHFNNSKSSSLLVPVAQ